MRVEPFSVITLMLSTTPGTTSCSRPTYSPSVFSRTIIRSTPGYFVSRPGRFLMGLKFANRSNFLRSVTLMLLKPPPIGVVTGPFSATLVALDRLIKRRGNVLAVDLEGIGAGGVALPLPLHAGRFKNADHRLRHFRADAVAGNQRNCVRLLFRHDAISDLEPQEFLSPAVSCESVLITWLGGSCQSDKAKQIGGQHTQGQLQPNKARRKL